MSISSSRRPAAKQELSGLGARELAARVRSGAVTAEEVAREHLDRIEAIAPALGAFQIVDRELTLRDARGVDADAVRRGGPLAGVPVAIKDNFEVAGLPTRNGSAATPDTPASADHELVRRLRAAGAFVVGKTTMPELAIWPFTESAAFGVARNPWAPDRTAGGSTGGGAIAVATRTATLALGSDGGGSIRIPAACCGVVGYKPAPGLLPAAGTAATHWLGLSASGLLARSVDDTVLMLDVLAGRPPRPAVVPPVKPLRIAVSTHPILLGSHVDPEVVSSTTDAARRLAGAGHTLVDADPPYPKDLALRFMRRWLPGIAEDVEPLDPSRLERRTRKMARAGRLLRRLGLATPVDQEPLARTMTAWFAGHDLLLTPTLSSPPVPGGSWKRGWIRTTLSVGKWIMTSPWNLVAFPAISMPAGLSKDGLPLAVQLVAPPGREDLVLAAAQQLGELMPIPAWHPEG